MRAKEEEEEEKRKHSLQIPFLRSCSFSIHHLLLQVFCLVCVGTDFLVRI